MKQVAALLILLLSLLSGHCQAQLTMFEGRIVDAVGSPVKGAIIQLKWRKDKIETRSDDDGLFYTTLIPTGMYRIGVEADGKYYKLRGLKVLPSTAKKYYLLSIHGGRLYVDVSGQDPFLKSKLSKISNSDPRQEVLWGNEQNYFRVKIDSATGKGQLMNSAVYDMPSTKIRILK